MDQAAILDHHFRIAAYVITWVIQLSYLAWLGIRWRAEKRNAGQRDNHTRWGTANAPRAKMP